MTPGADMGPIWDPYGGPLGPYGAPWAPWAMADGPRPMGLEDPGLEDPPVGVYFRARGRWGPMGSMGLGDPPMGVSSSKYPPSAYFYIFIQLSKYFPGFLGKQIMKIGLD